MKRWPVEPRGGFTQIPNDVLARAIGELAPAHLRLFLGLVYSAEFKPEGSTSPDGRWRIGFGQVLVSHDSLAAAYGMERDAVRRALRRFEEVALATAGRPAPATPGATVPATAPNVVTLGPWFGNVAAPTQSAIAPAPESALAPAMAPATIQDGNTRRQEGTTAAAEARDAREAGATGSAAEDAGGELPRIAPVSSAPELEPSDAGAGESGEDFPLHREIRRALPALLPRDPTGKIVPLLPLRSVAELRRFEEKARAVGKAAALAFCCERGKRYGKPIESMRFFLNGLDDLAAERAEQGQPLTLQAQRDRAIAAAEGACLLWATMLRDVAKRTPPAEFVQRLAPIRARLEGHELVLETPNPRWLDAQREQLEAAATAAQGEPVRVRVLLALPAEGVAA